MNIDLEQVIKDSNGRIFHDYSGGRAEDKRRADYGQPGYVGLVARAVSIILETDNLKEIDRSEAPRGGAIAFEKP